MAENQKTKLLGSVELTKYNGYEFIKRENVKGIFIPITDNNPSISFVEKEGKRRVFLNMEIIETPRSKYNSHAAKATANKETRERLGINKDNEDAFFPFIGNFDLKNIAKADSPQSSAPGPETTEDMPGDDAW